MQGIEKLNIRIIDTEENDRSLVFESAQIESPRLIYNGQDDKFANLMTSELHFNLVVNSLDEAVFFHLFTGTETRFKVVLEDVTDPLNPALKWSGFLLPEQFSEPYKNTGYFVEFIATDGIGRLKNTNLSTDFYQDKKSVISVLSKCLLQTGVVFPILFAPAVQNSGFNLNYKDLLVNTASYIKDDEKKSTYDILVLLLESIGCRLFQYKGQWVIVGLNLINDVQITFNKYEYSEFLKINYVEDVVIDRNIISSTFYATPTVSILPILKTMTTTWDAENKTNLIPEDVVTHLPVNITTDINDRTAKYWALTTNKSVLLQVWLLLLDSDFDYSTIDYLSYFNGFKAQTTPTLDDVNSGPFIVLNSINAGTMALADLPDNFITLSDAFYVNGAADLERFASLKLEFFIPKSVSKTDTELKDYFAKEGSITSVANNGSGKARVTATAHGLVTGETILIENSVKYSGVFQVTVINGNAFDIDINFDGTNTADFKLLPFAKNFFFAITRKDFKTQADADAEIVFSNFTTAGIPENKYGFTISYDKLQVKGGLDLEKILLETDGWYNIRLYPHVTNDFLGDHLIFNTCNFTLNTESKVELKKERNLNFTTKHDLDLFHNSSQLALSDKSYSFSEAIETALSTETLIPLEIEVTPAYYNKETVSTNGAVWYHKITVGFSAEDFVKLQNGYNLFIKKNGLGAFLPIEKTDYIEGLNEIVQFSYVALNTGVNYIEEDDTIFLKINTSTTNTINYAEYWLNKWRRVGVVESLSFLEVINRIYLGVLNDYNFRITGTVMSFLLPLDLLDFKYKGVRRYTPVEIDLNLTEGVSEVTLIESKYKDVVLDSDTVVVEEDNSDDVVIIPPPKNPKIEITSTAVAPNASVYVWTILTNYIFTDFDVVNATITASQLTDSVANGGVKTGLVKSGNITNKNGSYTTVFPWDVFADNGWYEIAVTQNGVVSNLEYVPVINQVDDAVETEDIVLTKGFLTAAAVGVQNYFVDYKVAPVGVVEQYLQKFDISTQSNIGSTEVTEINALLTEHTVDFTNRDKAWKLKLKNNGKFSNEIVWFGF